MSLRTECVYLCLSYLVRQIFLEKKKGRPCCVSWRCILWKNSQQIVWINVTSKLCVSVLIIHKIVPKSSTGFLCCNMMSPLWVQQTDLARVNMSSSVFPPPDIDWARTHTFSAEASTQPERRDCLQLREPAVVCSELGLFSSWLPRSPLASSLHGTPDLAAKHTTTIHYGLPWCGDPFNLQG